MKRLLCRLGLHRFKTVMAYIGPGIEQCEHCGIFDVEEF